LDGDKAMTNMITFSSRLTFFYKVIFPVIWISGFGLGMISVELAHNPPLGVKFPFAAGWVLGTVCLVWLCAPLKRVRADDRALYVSNYLKEISVPVGLIDRVTENRWINIHPVTIHLSADTEFGRKIVFMPKARMAFVWSRHPVVGEIERLAQTAAAGGAP
jgi:hypothetical protein